MQIKLGKTKKTKELDFDVFPTFPLDTKIKIKMIDSYFENNDLYNLIIIKFV